MTMRDSSSYIHVMSHCYSMSCRHIGLSLCQYPMLTSIPSVSSLGRCMRNSKFDEIDFLLYECLCDEFFRSPRGHLALLAGGVIACLVCEVIPFSKVYDGPADNVEKDGMFICKVEGQPGYYSDILSEAEVSLVCIMLTQVS